MSIPYFDIIALADSRFPGGTSSALCREIDALTAGGLRVALAPVRSPIFRRGEAVHPELARRIASGALPVVGNGEEAECGLLVAHNPMVFEQPPAISAGLRPSARILVVHQAPVTGDGRLLFDPLAVDATLEGAFGGPWHWAATGPAGRANLAGCGCALRIAERSWPLVLDAEPWGRPRPGIAGPVPVAGRHSRPDRLKWPSDARDLLRAFPGRPDLRVRLLGWNEAIGSELGKLPANWELLPFGAEPAADFLRSLDFFVYHHHREWFETFGLTVAEAMASGAVAILAPGMRETFGDAALYAEPEGVFAFIEALARDSAAYARQSTAGWEWVRQTLHPDRIVETARDWLNDVAEGREPPHLAAPATKRGEELRRRLARRHWLRQGAAALRRIPGGEAVVRAVRRIG